MSLTFSLRRSLLYRNRCVDLLSKSTDWFLYDRDPRHERVKQFNIILQSFCHNSKIIGLPRVSCSLECPRRRYASSNHQVQRISRSDRVQCN